MSAESSLSTGMHYFNSKRYDEAIEYCSKLLQESTNKSADETAKLNVLVGRCYYNKITDNQSSHNTKNSHLRRKTQTYAYHHLSITIAVSTRMTDEAIQYFDLALQHSPNSSSALYWKGKALLYNQEKQQAYECFSQASLLSPRAKAARQKCEEIFASNSSFPFLSTRSFEGMSIKAALVQCKSSKAYERMEACHFFSQLNDFSTHKKEIEKELKLLCGKKLLCCSLPCTGDSDKRVKDLANILRNGVR